MLFLNEHVVRRSAPRVVEVGLALRARRPEEWLCVCAVRRADGSESRPYPSMASLQEWLASRTEKGSSGIMLRTT